MMTAIEERVIQRILGLGGQGTSYQIGTNGCCLSRMEKKGFVTPVRAGSQFRTKTIWRTTEKAKKLARKWQ